MLQLEVSWHIVVWLANIKEVRDVSPATDKVFLSCVDYLCEVYKSVGC